LVFLFLSAVYLFVVLTTKFWNGEDKLSFVYFRDNGDVSVTVLDPELEETTVLIIPGETEVDVARNYGTLRLKNVWQLGINEKLDGNLLSQTVTKNFLFPVFLWSDTDIGSLKFVFFPGRTNIPFGDRLSVALFAMKVGNLSRVEINLAESQFLRRQVLSDGQLGYKINGNISERLTVYFADNVLSGENLKIYIRDTTGVFGVSEKVGEILEVAGGKVVTIDRGGTTEVDCEILAKNPSVAKKVAKLFTCTVIKDKTDFDLEVRLGKKFAERF